MKLVVDHVDGLPGDRDEAITALCLGYCFQLSDHCVEGSGYLDCTTELKALVHHSVRGDRDLLRGYWPVGCDRCVSGGSSIVSYFSR